MLVFRVEGSPQSAPAATVAGDPAGTICGLLHDGGIDKTRNMKITNRLGVCVLAISFVILVYTVGAEEPTTSPAPSASETAEGTTSEDTTTEGTTKKVDFPSPNEKFAFLIGHGDDGQTIDLIDKKTEKVLQHIDDLNMGSVTYRVLWAPDSKRFALMTRAGHPNQDVMVFLQNGKEFQKIKIPKLTAEIPARIKAGKDHPHVAANNWQEAEKWNKDGSLLLTIDNTIDGAGHTASAERTVLLGFDKSGRAKILKSKVKYESRND
jgi:hypothetical protein